MLWYSSFLGFFIFLEINLARVTTDKINTTTPIITNVASSIFVYKKIKNILYQFFLEDDFLDDFLDFVDTFKIFEILLFE